MAKNIALLYGGESCEHDISIITAISIYNAIRWDYNVILVYMKNGKFLIGDKLSKISTYTNFNENKLTEVFFQNGCILKRKKYSLQHQMIDCALICNHGGAGEDGSLSGFFEIAKIPYTGCGVLASSICMDKVFAKYLLEKFHFPVLSYKVFKKGMDIEYLQDIVYPVIIKPACLGSSVGISIANDEEGLKSGIELGLMFDDKLLIEKALTEFEEYNCAVCLGDNEILVSEIEKPIFNTGYLNFYDKYISTDNTRELPAKVSKKIKDKIYSLCNQLYTTFELKGVVRIDFLYKGEKLYVNEINTIPGSLSTYLFKAKGIDTLHLIDNMIENAIAVLKEKRKKITDFSSSVLKNLDKFSLKTGVKK
jgi:D-alanine-D-alanine ligase